MKEKDFIFGIRAVIEALDSDKEIDRIVIRRDLQGDLVKELLENSKDVKIFTCKKYLEKD